MFLLFLMINLDNKKLNKSFNKKNKILIQNLIITQ